jgi:hypothetical protein
VRNNKRGEYTHRILVAQGDDYHIGLYTQQDAKPTYKIHSPSRNEVEIASAKLKKHKSPVTNQNLIQEEINRKLNSGNACYHSIRNLLSSRLLSKTVKIRICKTIIFLAVLYGYETSSLTVRENVRRMSGPKMDEVMGG